MKLQKFAAFALAGCITLAVLAFAACNSGTNGGKSPGGSGVPSGGAAMGPGISVQEALASDLEGPLLVNGWLRAEMQDVRLCSSLTESTPPLCSGTSLLVRGLDLSDVKWLRTEGTATWSTRQTQVLGEVKGGVLTVSGLSTG